MHPGSHHGRVDGFGDEIYRPGSQPRGFFSDVVQRGDEDNRDVACGSIGLEASAHFQAIHVGHHHIQQHQVRRIACTGLQCLRPTGGHEDLVVLAENVEQCLDVDGLIVHYQKPGQLRRWGHGCLWVVGGMGHALNA